jgi:hypothetical protein
MKLSQTEKAVDCRLRKDRNDYEIPPKQTISKANRKLVNSMVLFEVLNL